MCNLYNLSQMSRNRGSCRGDASQAPDDVAELGLGADPAQEARQGSLRRRAARASGFERPQEDEVLATGPDAVAAERAGRRDSVRVKPERVTSLYVLGEELLQR